MDANFRNFLDRESSWLPVAPNLVLIWPTALAASSNDTGSVVARSSTVLCSSFAASPVAPVFLMTVSIASSTSENAATAAVPVAAIGPVTYFVMFSPTLVIFSPVFCSDSPIDSNASCALFGILSSSSVKPSSCFLVAMISRCSACCCFSSSGVASCLFSCSCAFSSSCSRSLVPLTASVSSFCFCASNSVFRGSIFRSFSTSFSCD